MLLAAGLLAGLGAGEALPASSSVRVELVLSADRAVWRPQGGTLNSGTITLRRVSPRMAMLAAAPRHRAAVVPVGFLPVTWRQIVPRSTASATKGKRVTNGVIAFGSGDDRQLVPVQLELVGSFRDGSRLAFRVRPLTQTAHAVDSLAAQEETYRDVSVVVDPSISDAVKALWNSLSSWVWSTVYGIPPDPVTNPDAPAGSQTFNSGYFPGDPDPVDGYTPQVGRALQGILQSNWEASGYTVGGALGQSESIDRFAVYPFLPDQPDVGINCCEFGVAGAIQEVTNSAIFGASLVVNADGVEFGGLSLRGSEITGGSISNSLFSAVDMTGFSFNGTGDDRVTVRGSVFENVKTNVDPTRGDVTERLGGPYAIQNADFTAVAFENVGFAEGTVTSGTFASCSLQGVDFSGSTITGGSDASPGGQFEPTFDGSLFNDVTFDGAVLANVSFAGVDFSGGGVTFDGTTLRNVDFTGALGLQFVDFSGATFDGNVYGLSFYEGELNLADPSYLRSVTFDGQVPEIDDTTGFDVEPDTGYLIDPATGVRLVRDEISGNLNPVDPETGSPLQDTWGDPLIWSADTGLTDPLGNPYQVDIETGELIGPAEAGEG